MSAWVRKCVGLQRLARTEPHALTHFALTHSRSMYLIAHNGAHIWGGAERATALLLSGLQSRGHRVMLFCNDPLVAAGADALGIPTRIVPLGGDLTLPHAVRLARQLRRERPDVFLIGTYRKLFLAALGARLAGVPRVVARVGLETDTPRSAKYRFVIPRWVDAVVVNAARMLPAFTALPGFPAARAAVIPNGVHPPVRVQPDGAVRVALGIALSAPVVGTVGRLARQKRIDRLLTAVSNLPAHVHCVVAGDGEEREKLVALAAELGIAARVHFLGARDDLGDVLGAMDVFVLSSGREGMSSAMLEALAAGVPVVSTPVSGTEEALEPLADGRAPGVVLSSFDPAELARTLAELLADPARLAGMGAAARERAAERFGMEAMLDRWDRVLRG